VERLHLVLVEAEAADVAEHDVGIEDAHDDLLAERGGKRRDAEFDLLAAVLRRDAAVLRAALLRDVHPAHRLEARGDGEVDELRHALDLVEHAVDAEADLRELALRLDVDVGGARVVRVLEEVVDGVDDVRVGGLDLGAGLELDVLLEVAEVEAALEVAFGFGDSAAEAVLLVDDGKDVALRRDDDVDLLLHHRPVRVEGDGVVRIDDGDDELPVLHRHRDHAVLAGERAGDLRLDHLHVEPQRVDLEEREVRLFGDEARQEEVVDAGAAAAGVGEVHRRERAERTGLVLAAALRARAAAELAVDVVDLRPLPVVDEPRAEQQVAEVGDGDLAGTAGDGDRGDGHMGGGNSSAQTVDG
jgi:hypothetical protein